MQDGTRAAAPAVDHADPLSQQALQKRVPVLVDGSEVIHDSRRINQYLDWKHGGDP